MKNINVQPKEDLKSVIGFLPACFEALNTEESFTNRIAEDLTKPQLFDAELYQDYSIDQVLNYLRLSHEFYLSKKLPEIEQQLTHVYTKFPEYKLFRILHLFFQEYKSHLVKHIESEENTIFKYVDLLMNTKGVPSEEQRFYLLQGSPSLNHFLSEHTDTEKDLSAMRKVLKSEESYRQLHPISMLFHQLARLENHLNIHARIEDEVFVPKALELEAKYL